MSDNCLKYESFIGSVECCLESNTLHGKLLFINDVITYSAENISKLKKEFEEAVRDYIATCGELGKEPEQPFKGTFNVRVGSENHKRAALEAYRLKISLNEFVKLAIEEKFDASNYEEIVHHHYHKHFETRPISMSETFATDFEDNGDTYSENVVWQ